MNIYVSDTPTNQEIIGTVAKIVGCEAGDYQEQLAYLQNDQVLITAEMAGYFADKDKQPQVAEVVMLLANLYQSMSYHYLEQEA